MSPEHNDVREPDGGLSAALVACLEALDAGRPPDRQELLARYPQHAAELARFLDDQEQVDRCAAPLRALGVGGEPAGGAPERLGDFRIVREVGRGGMGIVYEAEQVSLRRRVALKVLPLAGMLDPRQRQRFRNEAQAAACLHHTNIVPVYFVGEERGVHFYAMQFIDGRPLSDLVRQLRQAEPNKRPGRPRPEDAPASQERTAAFQPAPGPGATGAATVAAAADDTPLTSEGRRSREYYRRVAELGVQAAEALDHAHQLGIVHRDVKPANLLLGSDGRLWVTDFGLAQVQHGEAGLTVTGDLVGTLRYMSPEQALAKRVPIDHRTDVYSLGATLYELLTLRPAFQGSDRQELLRQIAFEEPPPPRRLERAVPAELETVVLKALEKNPADRYATARELADDLRHWLEDRPIRARRASLVQRARKWAQRHRVAVVAAAVCLLVTLVAGGGSVGWVLNDREARQREARAKVREAEGKVQEALAAAGPGLREGNPWGPALVSAVQRADAQLGTGALGPDLRACVEQLRRDHEMLTRLENARLQRAAGDKETGYNYAGSGKLYTRAFEGYGLDLTSLGPRGAAERMRTSAICTHLVAALDDWAFIRDKLIQGGGAPLRAVADLADDDPWRRRLREATRRRDRPALEGLAEDEGALSHPPTNLVLLAYALKDTGSEAAVARLLRWAQAGHPEDFWINFELAIALREAASTADAVRFYQAALTLRPQSAVVYSNFGNALHDQGKLAEAEAACRKAIELQPELAQAHYNLGVIFGARGKLAAEEEAYRKAIELWPDYARAYNNLGVALGAQGKLAEAEAACRKAIELQPNYVKAYGNLGKALHEQGKFVEAVAVFRKAVELGPEKAFNLFGLANALRAGGEVDKAIAAYRDCIRLNPDLADAHCNLAIALHDKHDEDGAIAEYREAIRLKKDSPNAHYNLAVALHAQRKLDEAIAEYREAIRLKNDYAQAHCNLAHVLRDKGQFAEALTYQRRGHELGSKDPRWPYPSAQWVKQCERLAELDGKLPRVLKGEAQPADAGERLALAQLCQEHRKRYAAAARFLAAAFDSRPALAEDLASGHRYNAACAAALAGCGRGEDAAGLHAKERARLRKQALDWLHADLGAWRKLLDKEPDKARPAVAKSMEHWLGDADFAGVRGPEALGRLPAAERQDWQKLWQEVEALRTRAAERPKATSSARP